MTSDALEPGHFARVDETDDRQFYAVPRLVKHIDEPACEALAGFYQGLLPHDGRILDLMSSCVSHLPLDRSYPSVIGLGMNEAELLANDQLTDRVIHDLNRGNSLPFADASFDACVISVSVQYLTRPVEIFADIARVLRAESVCAVSFSNRMFPTKAIAIWRMLGDADHARLVAHYLDRTNLFCNLQFSDLSPSPGRSDPLYAVWAHKV